MNARPIGRKCWAVPEGYHTLHLRLNNLQTPAPIPTDTEFSTLIKSDVPVVVQHTRLDSRQAENALMTTLAFPVE